MLSRIYPLFHKNINNFQKKDYVFHFTLHCQEYEAGIRRPLLLVWTPVFRLLGLLLSATLESVIGEDKRDSFSNASASILPPAHRHCSK